MKQKIIANNLKHLQRIIKKEIQQNGNNCDLNQIDVSLITDMDAMFAHTQFTGDISNWKPINLETIQDMFINSKLAIPYWAEYGDDNLSMKQAINSHLLKEELINDLNENNHSEKKLKI